MMNWKNRKVCVIVLLLFILFVGSSSKSQITTNQNDHGRPVIRKSTGILENDRNSSRDIHRYNLSKNQGFQRAASSWMSELTSLEAVTDEGEAEKLVLVAYDLEGATLTVCIRNTKSTAATIVLEYRNEWEYCSTIDEPIPGDSVTCFKLNGTYAIGDEVRLVTQEGTLVEFKLRYEKQGEIPSLISSELLYVILATGTIIIAGIVIQRRRKQIKRKKEGKKTEAKKKKRPKAVCPYCGRKVKSDDVYCSKCGRILEEKEGHKASEILICPVCKNEIQEDWFSCPYCGVKLKQDDTQIY